MQFHCIKVRYSLEPRDRIYVKGYGFMSFARSMCCCYLHDDEMIFVIKRHQLSSH